MKAFLLILCLVLVACGTDDALVADDASVEAFCTTVVPILEEVDADNPTSARTAAAAVSTGAQKLAPADAAELTSESVTLQAEVTAGLGWTTSDIVTIVNRVCSTDLSGVSAEGIIGE